MGVLFRNRLQVLLTHFKSIVISASIIALLISLPDVLHDWEETQKIYLLVEMKSSKNSIAQLYFDIGNRLNEIDSVSNPVLADVGFQTLRFELPEENILNLRFDPMMTDGTCALQNIRVVDGIERVIRNIDMQTLQGLNQIQDVHYQNGKMRFEVRPGSHDPMLSFDLKYPLVFRSEAGLADFSLQVLKENARLIMAVFLLSTFCLMFIISDLTESSDVTLT